MPVWKNAKIYIDGSFGCMVDGEGVTGPLRVSAPYMGGVIIEQMNDEGNDVVKPIEQKDRTIFAQCGEVKQRSEKHLCLTRYRPLAEKTETVRNVTGCATRIPET